MYVNIIKIYIKKLKLDQIFCDVVETLTKEKQPVKTKFYII